MVQCVKRVVFIERITRKNLHNFFTGAKRRKIRYAIGERG